MTATLSMSPLACWLIGLYQKYLSPRKGFRCAYRVRHRRRASCSQFARRAIERLGVLPGVRLLRRRFHKCHRAAEVLDYETPRRKEEEARRRESSWSPADCTPDSGSGCDVSGLADGCDLLGSAAGACDVGACDVSI